VDDIQKSPVGRDSRGDEARQKIRKVSELIQLSRDVKHQQLRGSLKGSKAIDVFVSEREREREL
jgi:hypothetical protein